MKRKTFITTLLLFLSFFYGATLFVSVVLWRDKLAAQKEAALAGHYMAMSSVIGDLQAITERGGSGEDSIVETVRSFASFWYGNDKTLSLYRDGLLLYDGRDKGKSAGPETEAGEAENAGPEMEAGSVGPEVGEAENAVAGTERTVWVEETEEAGQKELFLYVRGSFPQPWQRDSLVYRYHLKNVYEEWRKTKNMLFLCGGISSLLLSFCLLVLLNRLFRPLLQIAETSRKMAEGNFEGRLTVSGHDELTGMAESFNHMANTIKEQIAALKAVAEQKQRMVDNFAHELRTPMTAIYGYAEYLQKAAVTEEDRSVAAEYIMSECSRLSGLSRQLLELAALHGDSVSMERLRVSELFHTVGFAMIQRGKERGIEVTLRAGEEELTGSRELLESLLLNLIENAIHACDGAGKVTAEAEMENGVPVLSVADNGRGMSAEDLSHIREAFYRVDKARSRREGGAGLGLYFCEQIVEIHGAKMEISSEQGRGTEVRILFLSEKEKSQEER